VLHARRCRQPLRRHTLRDVIEDTSLTGCPIERAYVDKDTAAHGTENRAASSSQAERGVLVSSNASCDAIRHRPIIGLEGRRPPGVLSQRPRGDAANVILSVVGHNFGRILAW